MLFVCGVRTEEICGACVCQENIVDCYRMGLKDIPNVEPKEKVSYLLMRGNALDDEDILNSVQFSNLIYLDVRDNVMINCSTISNMLQNVDFYIESDCNTTLDTTESTSYLNPSTTHAPSTKHSRKVTSKLTKTMRTRTTIKSTRTIKTTRTVKTSRAVTPSQSTVKMTTNKTTVKSSKLPRPVVFHESSTGNDLTTSFMDLTTATFELNDDIDRFKAKLMLIMITLTALLVVFLLITFLIYCVYCKHHTKSKGSDTDSITEHTLFDLSKESSSVMPLQPVEDLGQLLHKRKTSE